jgi:hypothetical protein
MQQPFFRSVGVRPRQLVLVEESEAHAGRILARTARAEEGRCIH